MAATYLSATDSILKRIRDDWTASTGAIVGGAAPVLVFEPLETDLKPNPADGTLPWARVVVRHADSAKSSLAGDEGTGLYKRIGFAWVQVFVPSQGAKNWTIGQQLAVVARNAFEGKRTDQGVVFTKSTIVDRPKDGNWLTWDVKAPFYWFEVH